MSKRAVRRHHRDRLKCRRKYYHGRGSGPTDAPITEEFLGRMVDTPTPCSCQMCRNPRRSAWYKVEEKLTMQERRALLDD
jgi:hypothetical protein